MNKFTISDLAFTHSVTAAAANSLFHCLFLLSWRQRRGTGIIKNSILRRSERITSALDVDSNKFASRISSDLRHDQKAAPVYRDEAEREKKFHAQTQKKYFDINPKRKDIKRDFYTCLLQAQEAEMVSRENKTEGLFLPTIALSYKNLLESLASPQCQPPLPPPPFLSFFPLSEAGQGPLCTLIGCGLMLSNNIPVP